MDETRGGGGGMVCPPPPAPPPSPPKWCRVVEGALALGWLSRDPVTPSPRPSKNERKAAHSRFHRHKIQLEEVLCGGGAHQVELFPHPPRP